MTQSAPLLLVDDFSESRKPDAVLPERHRPVRRSRLLLTTNPGDAEDLGPGQSHHTHLQGTHTHTRHTPDPHQSLLSPAPPAVSHLQQQQAQRQTPDQHQVGSGPAHNLVQTARGEDAPPCRSLVQRLHPVTTHGVQDSLQGDGTGETHRWETQVRKTDEQHK